MIDSRAQVYLGHLFLLSSLSAFSANWDCESLNGASISFFRVSILVSALESAWLAPLQFNDDRPDAVHITGRQMDHFT